MRIFDSGNLANPDFEIDSLLPGMRVMVRIQLDHAEAERLIRWHRPSSVVLTADSDVFFDALIEAVNDWVATFPLLHASSMRNE